MRELNDKILFEGCQEIVKREANDGCWAGGKIPQVFYTIRDHYYPHLQDNDCWVRVIERVIESNAVRFVYERMKDGRVSQDTGTPADHE